MKKEQLYQGMTKDVARRYLKTRKEIEWFMDILQGIAEICEALELSDKKKVKIGAKGIGVIGFAIESQISWINKSLDEKFMNKGLLEEALNKDEEDS